MFGLHTRRVRALLSLPLLVAIASCSKPPAPSARPHALVPVVTSVTGTILPKSTLGGMIIPYQNVAIQSNLSEPTDAVYVNEGDHVRAGEVLAVLDTADLQAELRSDVGTAASNKAKADQTYDQAGLTIVQNNNTINSARAAVRQAEATLSVDSLNLQRDEQLVSHGYISQQTVDQQRVTVTNDTQSLRSAHVTLTNTIAQVKANGTTATGLQGAGVAAARADEETALGLADQVRTQIAKAKIISPTDGIVVNRNLNPGEYPGTRQLFTIQETDRVYAALNGSSSQIVSVKPGRTATITSPDLPGKRLSGQVVGVLDAVNPGSTNFIVKVLLNNSNGLLLSGMTVSGTVEKAPASGMKIPESSFADDTDSTVQTVRGGKIVTVKVTKIATDGQTAVVSGLNSGELVVANGQLGLIDGQDVTVEPFKVAER